MVKLTRKIIRVMMAAFFGLLVTLGYPRGRQGKLLLSPLPGLT